jgi:hypothetical protein
MSPIHCSVLMIHRYVCCRTDICIRTLYLHYTADGVDSEGTVRPHSGLKLDSPDL